MHGKRLLMHLIGFVIHHHFIGGWISNESWAGCMSRNEGDLCHAIKPEEFNHALRG